MARADDTLRDQWLAFVVREAFASAKQIAITNRPYWRLTETSCELCLAALSGKEPRDIAAQAARAAERAAQSAGWDASRRIPIDFREAMADRRAEAEECSAKAAGAAAEAAAAAAEAGEFANADHHMPWKAQQAASRAAEAARQAALGWMVTADAVGGREEAVAETYGEAALDANFGKVNHPAHFAMVSAISSESMSPENACRRMFDRLLDEIAGHQTDHETPR